MTDAELQNLADELGLDVEVLRKANAEGQLDFTDAQLAGDLARWLADPVDFVKDVFAPPATAWSPDGIDEWQRDALRAAARNPRVGLKACKGPGKTTVEAWFGWWCLALHAHANGLALSITKDNLRDNLWKELAVWYARSAWLQREFAMTGDAIFHRESPKTWWLHARSFAADADKDQQANTLAGLHSQSFVFILCDEVSDYPDGVLGAAEGIFANIGVEAHLLIAGNATRSEGPLFNACTRDRHRWFILEITGDPDDPKRSPRIDIAYAREAIDSWGREDPWVMTNILGLFPLTASDKLLGPNDITAATQRDAPAADYLNEPVLWGLDVARDGMAKSHLRKRQGPVLFRGYDFRGLDGVQLANQVSMIVREDAKKTGREPDVIYVDMGGVGSSAYDHLKVLGWGDSVVGVQFGEAADKADRFQNKRSEMWWRMADWVKRRACFPSKSAQLGADLTAPKYEHKVVNRRTVLCLETKEQMKKRGIKSPDEGDAVAMTFYSEVVVPKHRRLESQLENAARHSQSLPADYDPVETMVGPTDGGRGNWDGYDPMGAL